MENRRAPTVTRTRQAVSELDKILLTSLAAVAVYVAGQVLSKWFLDPLISQREAIARIVDALIYYANVFGNPGHGPPERMDEARRVLRERATEIRVRSFAIPAYRIWSCLRIALPYDKIVDASQELIGLSNSVHDNGLAMENVARRKQVLHLLGIGDTLD